MIKRLLVLVFLLMASCVPEPSEDPTPTREVWPTAEATARSAPPYLVVDHPDSSGLSLAPECANGACRFYLDGFAGTVGSVTDWQETEARTCYLARAVFEVDVLANRCDNPLMNFNFTPILHYEDGSLTAFSPEIMDWVVNVGLRSGYYNVVLPLLPVADGDSFLEMAFTVRYPCAAHGNSVTITNVTLEVAPNPNYCAQLGG